MGGIRLSKVFQLEHIDAGLIPESELNHRAAQNNLTPYEVIRRKDLYDLEAYMQVASIALEQKTEFYDFNPLSSFYA